MNIILRNKLTVFGGVIILMLLAVAILAPFISKYDPTYISVKDALLPPSGEHLLGTDSLGRDLFSRMIYASRIALMIGFVAVGLAALIGVMLGSIAGYFGGRIDSLVMRFADIMLCFPRFFLILSVIAVIGPSIFNVMLIIGLTGWMGIARLMRAEILSLKTRDFVEASRSLGGSHSFIMTRHLIPNGIAPVLVNFVFGVAGAILTEAGLSFLGLGDPSIPTWGQILENGFRTGAVFLGYWWWIIPPGLLIIITAVTFMFLAQGLEPVVDPRLRGKRSWHF